MPALKYQVLVMEQDDFNFASVPDLRCEAIGRSMEEAIATVQQDAQRILRDLEGTTVDPPRPSRLSLASIEIPRPPRQRPSQLRLLHGPVDSKA
jgi:hypothetical protein